MRFRMAILVMAIGVQPITAAQNGLNAGSASGAPPQKGTARLYVNPAESPGTLRDLCKLSDLVILGIVTSVLPGRQPSPRTIETDAVITVVQTLKGAAPNTEIAISQSGGTIGEVSLKPVQYALVQPGERYVLFLKEDNRPQLPAVAGLKRYRVTGESAGLFYLNGGALQLNAPEPNGTFQKNYAGASEGTVINLVTDAIANRPAPFPPVCTSRTNGCP